MRRYEQSLFFFSRRGRHTRCSRDWSSDVCSSDLKGLMPNRSRGRLFCARDRLGIKPFYYAVPAGAFVFASEIKARSEERRVGKEGRARGAGARDTSERKQASKRGNCIVRLHEDQR